MFIFLPNCLSLQRKWLIRKGILSKKLDEFKLDQYINRESVEAIKMQINDLSIQKYIKVANVSQLSSPELLSTLCVLDKKEYFRNIQSFEVTDQQAHRYQLYVSRAPPREDILQNIVFIKESPKLLYLKGQGENLILEERVQDRLSDYQVFHQSKESPYLSQTEGRNILMDLTKSIHDYGKHKIDYDCISPKNVVRMDQNWYLSAVGLIFGVDKSLPEFTSPHFDGQDKKIVYSFSCLLFKLVFGFVPFQKNSSAKTIRDFKFKNYLSYLEHQEPKANFIKIYYYGFRVLQISPLCLDLLELGLSGKLNLKQWEEHDYFTTPLKYQSLVNEKNRELKMVNSVQANNYSIMMAAIEYKNKYPLQKLNNKPHSSAEEPSYSEIIQKYRKNYLLKNLRFVNDFQRKEIKVSSINTEAVLPTLINDYFYEEFFDPEEDYPCRELLKLIEKEKQDHPQAFQSDRRQAEIKLYAFPYAVAFELCKVEGDQPSQLRKKIKKAISLLLQLSTIYYPGNMKPLHSTPSKFKQFSEMKTEYREHINDLYRYFLNEAMRKYNSKNQAASMIQKMKKKEKGLEYYRLCLKLLEASLIVRKGGRNLDLSRIQTSQRKEIEQDLEELLKNYFPHKAQIN